MTESRADHLFVYGTSQKAGKGRAKSSRFDERDWSLAWVNFLFQEAGCYHARPFTDWDDIALESYRSIYLPGSLWPYWEMRHSKPLENFLEAGGTLIQEGRSAARLGLGGFRLSGNERILKRITCIRTAGCEPGLAAALTGMPLYTLGGWLIPPSDPSLVLMEMDELPVLFREPVGEGNLVTLDFDFGLMLTALQQGRPLHGALRLEKLFGRQKRVIEPEDLVLEASLFDNPVPWADLFERFLYRVAMGTRPVPRWWYFPKLYHGVFMSTHDEEALGPDSRLEAMCELEKSMECPATVFVISDRELKERWGKKPLLSRWREDGHDVGLHWNRLTKRRWKIGKYRFGHKEGSLSEQAACLAKETGEKVTINRNHYLALGDRYGEHFRFLAREGIGMDSTYGPNQGGRGYLFGTGYPYWGLTWDGGLSGVLELPFLTQELWGGANLDFLKRIIRESDENFHQCVVVNFHPHYRVQEEEGRGMWLGGLAFAKERNQWITTMSALHGFVNERAGNEITSRMAAPDLLEIEARVKTEGATLALPSPVLNPREKSCRIEMDGEIKPGVRVTNAWAEEILLLLAQGTHRIKVSYEH